MTVLFEKEFSFQYSDADQHGLVRPVALLNYLQTAAGIHSALLGVSVPDLLEIGHTWVLTRIHLVMERYPGGGDTIRIRTWPALRETLVTVRDFEMFDTAGELIGRASTSWAVLNLKTRRLVKLVGILPDFPINPERALTDNSGPLQAVEKPEFELRLPVLRSDLDINRHVNNTVYAGWALETIPEEVDRDYRLAELEIGFRAEAFYGDSIIARTARTIGSDNGCCFIHCVENEKDGRELARLRTHWVVRTE